MKPSLKKFNAVLFALIMSALSSNSLRAEALAADQPRLDFLTHIDHIRNKTFASLTRVKPEDLERQIDPALGEVKKTPNIHEYIINHLFEIMLEVSQQEKEPVQQLEEASQQEKESVQKLKEELGRFTVDSEEDLNSLSTAQKEAILNSFSFESIAAIFDHIGEKIFTRRHPFRIPENTTNVSQLDMFFFLGTALTMQNANPVQEELHSSFLSCVGLKNVIKIQQRLNKPEIVQLLPASMRLKFFNTRNPIRIAAIVKQVMTLSRTYTNG